LLQRCLRTRRRSGGDDGDQVRHQRVAWLDLRVPAQRQAEHQQLLRSRRGPLRRNQFGGTVGGPVKLPGYNGKDRTFYFLSLEGTRQVASSTFSNVVVPSALERVGDFSQSKLPAGRAVAAPETVTPANPGGTPFPGNV